MRITFSKPNDINDKLLAIVVVPFALFGLIIFVCICFMVFVIALPFIAADMGVRYIIKLLKKIC